jgi:aryl carrier-like protein
MQLAEFFPLYMIPEAFLPVRWVPLSLNGKAERGKLRDWAAKLGAEKLAEHGQARVALRKPVTEAEIRLQGLWEEVLELPAGSVGADDNFFHLGADSIRAMSLVSAARKLGLAATVADVITRPTLKLMATVFVPLEETTAEEAKEVKEFELFGDVGLLSDILEPQLD